jgi:hypothetical protein
VVGAILGISKDVDIVFTRRFDICRLQVLVMNPNLIPQMVNVVIRDNLYELRFRVELNLNGNIPQPMEIDDFQEEGGADQGNNSGADGRGNRLLLGPNENKDGQSGKDNGNVDTGGSGVKKLVHTFHIQVPMLEDAGIEPVPGVQSLPAASR